MAVRHSGLDTVPRSLSLSLSLSPILKTLPICSPHLLSTIDGIYKHPCKWCTLMNPHTFKYNIRNNIHSSAR